MAPGHTAPMNFSLIISEIVRAKEELKYKQQAQPRCDFSEFAQQPSKAAALGPQLGGNGKSWRSTLQGRRDPPIPPRKGGLGSCGQTGYGTSR